jgi:hypothetical protein
MVIGVSPPPAPKSILTPVNVKTSSPSVRRIAGILSVIGLFAAPAVHAVTTVVQADFNYADLAAFNNDGREGGWANIAYNTAANPSFTALDNGNSAVGFNNRGLQQNFTSTLGGNLTTDFTFTVNFAQASSSAATRGFYALITSPVSSNTDTSLVSGYGIKVDIATDGTSTVRFLKVSSSNQTSGWSASGPSNSTTPTTPVSTGFAAFNTNNTAPTLTSQFHSITMTWQAATGAMSLFLDGSLAAATTYTDTSFNSFGEIYLSGNATGYVDSVLLTTNIPEPSTYAAGMGAALILFAGFRRNRQSSKKIP